MPQANHCPSRRRLLSAALPALSRPLFSQEFSLPSAISALPTVSLDSGRQLFVDGFLIAHTTCQRTFHRAAIHPASAVLAPETPTETNGGRLPAACPFNHGVWYDPADRLFKMWYMAGWADGVSYAISDDGIRWSRPSLGIEPGTNCVMPRRSGFERVASGLWLDHHAADPAQRFKMFVYSRKLAGGGATNRRVDQDSRRFEHMGGELYTSPDGIRWNGPTATGPLGDTSSIFYNPFRQTWVFNIRESWVLRGRDGNRQRVRHRLYYERPDFLRGTAWRHQDVKFWFCADEQDRPDPVLGYPPEIYDFEAAPYESVMFGLVGVLLGPPNEVCAKEGRPKTIDLLTAFSRDGLAWSRPDRESLIRSSRRPKTWDRGYLHPAGGVCLIVGGKLYIYYAAFSGVSPKLGADMYAGGSTGLAVLRRDGFASMDAGWTGGTLTTRPVVFQGRRLFVNCDTAGGELRVELLDVEGQPIPRFTLEEAKPIQTDATKAAALWREGGDLKSLAGTPVYIRFHLRSGSLYSFWVSPDESGASHGYVAAGGPGFTGAVDTTGA